MDSVSICLSLERPNIIKLCHRECSMITPSGSLDVAIGIHTCSGCQTAKNDKHIVSRTGKTRTRLPKTLQFHNFSELNMWKDNNWGRLEVLLSLGQVLRVPDPG